MKKYLIGLAALAAGMSAQAANAGIVITTTPGQNPYAGPGFTPLAFFDLNSPTARWDRALYTGTFGSIRAQPFGSTGSYASVGPADGTPGTFNLTGLGFAWDRVSFIWGSVDTYNTLEVLGPGNSVLFTITGNQIVNPANGDQSLPATNPVVTLRFTDADIGRVTGLRFNSTQNAFEFDNLAVGIPEPATWAMMIGGFGLIGFAARRNRRVSVSYA